MEPTAAENAALIEAHSQFKATGETGVCMVFDGSGRFATFDGAGAQIEGRTVVFEAGK
jgi:thiamine pyrophosphate-dependent acetolactate synthase large subunit-like protein